MNIKEQCDLKHAHCS